MKSQHKNTHLDAFQSKIFTYLPSNVKSIKWLFLPFIQTKYNCIIITYFDLEIVFYIKCLKTPK